MNPRLEKIKQENPTLWNEIKEYFSPAGLARQLREYEQRREIAEAQIARLQEERRLIDLRSETTLLESRNRKLRQQQSRSVEKITGARLLSDDEVNRMYNRWR
jgi:predicted  nucleic acid-binding Zn-ribbon protein